MVRIKKDGPRREERDFRRIDANVVKDVSNPNRAGYAAMPTAKAILGGIP
jgi:hypothetical protein